MPLSMLRGVGIKINLITTNSHVKFCEGVFGFRQLSVYPFRVCYDLEFSGDSNWTRLLYSE